MNDAPKPIRLSDHARDSIAERGAHEDEVILAIRSEAWQPADRGRFDCRKNFPFNAVWHGRHYATRQVRPIFVDEPTQIAVVTVYVYYF